jgi:hypothetical protein
MFTGSVELRIVSREIKAGLNSSSHLLAGDDSVLSVAVFILKLPRRNLRPVPAHACSERARSIMHGGTAHLAKRANQELLCHRAMRRHGSDSKLDDTVGPVELVAAHRCNKLGNAGAGSGCGGAGAAVMDHCPDSWKENVVAHVAHGDAVGRIIDKLEIGPTSRENDPAARGTRSDDQPMSRIT